MKGMLTKLFIPLSIIYIGFSLIDMNTLLSFGQISFYFNVAILIGGPVVILLILKKGYPDNGNTIRMGDGPLVPLIMIFFLLIGTATISLLIFCLDLLLNSNLHIFSICFLILELGSIVFAARLFLNPGKLMNAKLIRIAYKIMRKI